MGQSPSQASPPKTVTFTNSSEILPRIPKSYPLTPQDPGHPFYDWSPHCGPRIHSTARRAGANPKLPEHTGPLPNSFIKQGGRISFEPRRAFPRLDERAIHQIQSLRFKPEHLHILDPRVGHPRSRPEYKTPDSILVPLENFFLILAPAIPSELGTRTAFQAAAMQYTAYLTEMAAVYRWSAVYRYHLDFFASRMMRSRGGDWLSWGVPDPEIAGRWLSPERKLTSCHRIRVELRTRGERGARPYPKPCRHFI